MKTVVSRIRVSVPFLALACGLAFTPLSASALPQEAPSPDSEAQPFAALPIQTDALDTTSVAVNDERFSIFTPTKSPVRHRIAYDIWDFALKSLVISMGPSTRQSARPPRPPVGTRIRQGHNSRYRLEGSMLGFSFLDQRAIASFGEYRRELEQVAETLDISSLPRNEQLACWYNLHNVAMVEKIAENWPGRQPRTFELDGVPLNDARFLNIRGVSMSLRDIRENIVYANWRDPRVIYGFWLGEIGSPALERNAFTGANVNSLLSFKAEDFVNSLRGTQKRGKTLEVATFFEEESRIYFPDFEPDLRAHIAQFAKEDVLKILKKTQQVNASIREWDIADLSGGRRSSIANPNADARVGFAVGVRLRQRGRKLDLRRRREERTGRVFFTDIELPGQDPNAGQVE